MWLLAAIAVLALVFAGCSKKDSGTSAAAPAPAPAKTVAPIELSIMDVGGAYQFTKDAFERFPAASGGRVSAMKYDSATAPELPGKLIAMQAAGRADIDLVIGGLDILSSGITQGLWEKIFPDHQDKLPGYLDNLLDPCKPLQDLAQGFAVQVGFMYNGPMVFYNPAKISDPTTLDTPEKLLAWAKAHPGKFIYARPANSGPARCFMMGLPYLLGDKDPMDPVNGWDKTWAYMSELGKYVEYYPGGTGATMKEFGEGTRDVTVTTTGWDINPRAIGTVPENYKVVFFQNVTFVNDEQYLHMPKGLPADRKDIVLDLMNFMVQPAQQALNWDKGYFYPGPVIKNVPVTMAPQESQDIDARYGRPEYASIPDKYKQAVPLAPKDLVTAFQMWDDKVGSAKK